MSSCVSVESSLCPLTVSAPDESLVEVSLKTCKPPSAPFTSMSIFSAEGRWEDVVKKCDSWLISLAEHRRWIDIAAKKKRSLMAIVIVFVFWFAAVLPRWYRMRRKQHHKSAIILVQSKCGTSWWWSIVRLCNLWNISDDGSDDQIKEVQWNACSGFRCYNRI